MNEVVKAHIMILIATILIAGSFLASQKLSSVIDPISLTLLRFILALTLLSPIIIFSKNKLKKVLQSYSKSYDC